MCTGPVLFEKNATPRRPILSGVGSAMLTLQTAVNRGVVGEDLFGVRIGQCLFGAFSKS